MAERSILLSPDMVDPDIARVLHKLSHYGKIFGPIVWNLTRGEKIRLPPGNQPFYINVIPLGYLDVKSFIICWNELAVENNQLLHHIKNNIYSVGNTRIFLVILQNYIPVCDIEKITAVVDTVTDKGIMVTFYNTTYKDIDYFKRVQNGRYYTNLEHHNINYRNFTRVNNEEKYFIDVLESVCFILRLSYSTEKRGDKYIFKVGVDETDLYKFISKVESAYEVIDFKNKQSFFDDKVIIIYEEKSKMNELDSMKI